MTDLILFHHIQGLTKGVEEFAEKLRAAGHRVTVPDLFRGATFSTMEEGFAHAKELGLENMEAAGVAEAEKLPEQVVYAGFSMGAMTAHKLAQTRSGAIGALLYHHGDVPIDTFGDWWPKRVDLQIHISEHDEFFEPETAQEFVDKANTQADAELFIYPGSNHLFVDSSLPSFDPDSAELVLQRTIDFLERHNDR